MVILNQLAGAKLTKRKNSSHTKKLILPDSLLRQVLQQLLHPLNKRRELIWILLRKRFINLQGLFKSLPRLRWSVLGPIQNTQIVERRGDVRQISLRLFLRKLAVGL